MATVSYPGVYVEEVPSGVHTITGVATSIAAFFGRTERGPMNKAVRILSPSDFTRTFVRSNPLSDLAQSVMQFFANGGSDCYVVRLAKGAKKAAMTLRNLANRNVLTVTAKSEGVWGDGVRFTVDYDTSNPDDTFNLHVFYEEEGKTVSEERFPNLSMNPRSNRFAPVYVSQESKLIDLTLHSGMGDPENSSSDMNDDSITPHGYSQSRRPIDTTVTADADTDFRGELTEIFSNTGSFGISVNGGQYVDIDLPSLDFRAMATREDVASHLQNVINPLLNVGTRITCNWDQIGPETSNHYLLRITSNSEPYTSVQIRRGRQNDLAEPMMFGVNQGGIEVVRYSNLRPVSNGTVFMDYSSIDLLTGLPLSAISELNFDNKTIPIRSVINLDTELDTVLWCQEPGGGTDGVRKRLRLIAQAVTDDRSLPWRGEVWGYHLAFIRTEGSLNHSATVVLNGSASEEIRTNLADGFKGNVRRYSLGNLGRSKYQYSYDEAGETIYGIPGNDGDAPSAAEYLGDEEDQTGFYALDGVDLFNLMVLPGDREVDETVFQEIIGPASIYCQQNRAFLLIDAPPSWTSSDGRPAAAKGDIDAFRQLVVSDHAAVLYPRVEYSDAGTRKMIGPSGMVAGLMARIDSTRGVWKAPAGIEADIRGALDLEVNLTDRENGVLNQLAVNCLRKFPNGFVNWGARTLDGTEDSTSEWKYIPIRRLALYLEESLYRGTKWVVFEPNDEPLWAQIRLNLNAFMMSLFRRGAFQGSTPDKAFFVKCDGETTTPDDRNRGIVNIEVGFAPLKPAEFVIIRIQQMAGGLG